MGAYNLEYSASHKKLARIVTQDAEVGEPLANQEDATHAEQPNGP